MIPLRSSLKIHDAGSGVLLVRTAPGRRAAFLVAAIILIGAFVFGFDRTADFGPGRLAGTILFFVLVVVCLAVAAVSKVISIDLNRGEIVFGTMFVAGSIGSKRRIPLERVSGFVLWSVVLYRGREAREGSAGIADRYRKYVEVRSRLFRLYIESGDKRTLLSESAYAEEIESIAEAVSSFTEKPLAREEG